MHNAVLDNSINEIMSSVLVMQQEHAFLNEFYTIFICFWNVLLCICMRVFSEMTR